MDFTPTLGSTQIVSCADHLLVVDILSSTASLSVNTAISAVIITGMADHAFTLFSSGLLCQSTPSEPHSSQGPWAEDQTTGEWHYSGSPSLTLQQCKDKCIALRLTEAWDCNYISYSSSSSLCFVHQTCDNHTSNSDFSTYIAPTPSGPVGGVSTSASVAVITSPLSLDFDNKPLLINSTAEFSVDSTSLTLQAENFDETVANLRVYLKSTWGSDISAQVIASSSSGLKIVVRVPDCVIRPRGIEHCCKSL